MLPADAGPGSCCGGIPQKEISSKVEESKRE